MDPNKPIYLAVGSLLCHPHWRKMLIKAMTDVKIDGDIYDVSSNRRTYGPGGSYHSMYASSCCLIPRDFDW